MRQGIASGANSFVAFSRKPDGNSDKPQKSAWVGSVPQTPILQHVEEDCTRDRLSDRDAAVVRFSQTNAK